MGCGIDGEYCREEDLERKLEQAEASNRALLGTLEKARDFIEYARHELQPGKATVGDQFPRQVDADNILKMIAIATQGKPPEGT